MYKTIIGDDRSDHDYCGAGNFAKTRVTVKSIPRQNIPTVWQLMAKV